MKVARLLVLGALRESGTVHGYAIRQVLDSWQVQSWTNLRSGSVYHALQQLTKEGMIAVNGRDSGNRGPTKTLYSLTDVGATEFFELLRQALTSFDLIELSAGLAFIDAIPEGGSLLSDTKARLAENAARLQKMAVDTPPAKSAPRTRDLLMLWSENLAATCDSLAKIET